MFAQLLITAVTVWVIAEVLCRLILGRSVVAAARELFTPIAVEPAAEVKAPETNAALRRLLTERRQKLAAKSMVSR